MRALKAGIGISTLAAALLALTGCGGGGGGGSTTTTNVDVPNVVGDTQASASSAITGAGLTVGSTSMASSPTVASGDVISESPAAGTSVASGSMVSLTVSTGPATVSVPNVVGDPQAAASTAITGAGLTVGTVTMTSSSTVASGDIIGELPVAGTSVAKGSAVNLTVSTGPVPGNHYAYVSNSSDGTISAYSLGSGGALTALASSPIAVSGSSSLQEIKVDPSKKYVYVVSRGTEQIFGYAISPTTGVLTAVPGSPFATGSNPQSLTFDASGAYVYVDNVIDDTISGYALNAANGSLTALGGSPYALTTGTQPSQMTRAGNYLYVVYQASNSVEVLPINTGDGSLTVGVAGSPFPTDTGPFSIATDPAGTVLFTGNGGSGSGSITAFQIDLSTGVLTQFTSGASIPIPVNNDIAIDPQGKYLFVTERNIGGVVDVYPIDTASATGLDGAVAGSPFATGGNNPNSVSFDSSGKFAYVGNDGSATVSEFTLSAGVLTPIAGSPVAAGNGPDFIAVD
jgi:6-phosphogluconolactonase